MIRALLVLLLVGGSLLAAASRDGERDDGVGLHAALDGRQRVFQIGEAIPDQARRARKRVSARQHFR